jgi:hypothetical protein
LRNGIKQKKIINHLTGQSPNCPIFYTQQKQNKMNLTVSQSSQKEHLRNGSKTACNRRTSGIGISEFKDYQWNVDNYPEHCCKVCLTKYNEQLERLNKKAKI